MKTCKTCGGPLLYWNPEAFTYKEVITLLWKLHNAGETQLPEGIYTLEAAINCQKCAAERKVIMPRCKIGKVEQKHIIAQLAEPLTCSELSKRVGFSSRNGDRRLKTLVSQGVVKIVGDRPLLYVAA